MSYVGRWLVLGDAWAEMVLGDMLAIVIGTGEFSGIVWVFFSHGKIYLELNFESQVSLKCSRFFFLCVLWK